MLSCWVVLMASRARRARADPRELLRPSNILLVAVGYLLFVQYGILVHVGAARMINASGYESFLWLCFLSVTAFAFGESKGMDHGSRTVCRWVREAPRPMWPGAICVVGGMASWYYFLHVSGGPIVYYSSIHGSAGAWRDVSAYVPSAFLVVYVGVLMCLWEWYRCHSWMAFLFATLGLITVVGDAWLGGERSGWIRIALVLTTVWICHRPGYAGRLHHLKVVGLGVATVALMLLAPNMRDVVRLGSRATVLKAIRSAAVRLASEERPYKGTELLFATGVVAATPLDSVDAGLQWVYPLVNTIPRQLWPSKPYESQFSTSSYELAAAGNGWSPPEGANPTGFADAFIRWWWGAPLAWLVLGFVGGRTFVTLKWTGVYMAAGIHVSFLLGLFYFTLQRFNAGVYAAGFSVFPFVAVWAMQKLGGMNRESRRMCQRGF